MGYASHKPGHQRVKIIPSRHAVTVSSPLLFGNSMPIEPLVNRLSVVSSGTTKHSSTLLNSAPPPGTMRSKCGKSITDSIRNDAWVVMTKYQAGGLIGNSGEAALGFKGMGAGTTTVERESQHREMEQ
ncbi:MAG: hypothetical protein FRX49_00339 [Trebouxia sp. A1-2]|nr:MAG: hypothetical protein FRX49_00339 [Trebouxia sp. A1-2]